MCVTSAVNNAQMNPNIRSYKALQNTFLNAQRVTCLSNQTS